MTDWLNEQELTTTRGCKFTTQRTSELFRNKFYCGYITSRQYNAEKKGQHIPMISEATFDKVQAILTGRSPYKTQVKGLKTNQDFPLKRIIKCARCGAGLTAYWAKKKKYRYYECPNRCGKGYTIPAETIENNLDKLLRSLRPSHDFYRKFALVLSTKYQKKHQLLLKQKETAKKDLESLRGQLKTAAFKNLKGLYDDELFAELKAQLEDRILAKKIVLGEKILDKFEIDTLLDFMENLLSDLPKVFKTSSSGKQRLLLSSIFEEDLRWEYPGFTNSKISPIFRAIRDKKLPLSLPGEPGRDRTFDTLLKRQVLYH